MYTKKNARVTFRSNRRTNFKRNNNFSNNNPRNKGNITQQYNKYLKLAKESFSSGDRIQSEYYYQFTDHYYRLMLELGINIDEGETNQDEKITDDTNKENPVANVLDKNQTDKNETETETEDEVKSSMDNEDDIESIESIPFISEPAKKKSIKVKKVNV